VSGLSRHADTRTVPCCMQTGTEVTGSDTAIPRVDMEMQLTPKPAKRKSIMRPQTIDCR